ncbi:MAG: carboxyl transferase domain-containing protein [Thermomicrobiales bacterium]
MSTSSRPAAFREDWYEANLERVADLRSRLDRVAEGGGPRRRERDRERGKLPVRERIDRVIDAGTPFLELSPLAAEGMYDDEVPAAGIITGIGRVDGQPIMIVANDPTVKAGTYYPQTVKKHLRAQTIAYENRLPCLYLVDSGGAFLPLQSEVFPDREHFGRIFHNQANLSAAGIRQIAAVLGSCTAGGAYVPAMSDESIIVRGNGTIFLGGPPLVKAATGEEISAEELGGADVHGRISGVVDYIADSEEEALRLARRLLQVRGTTAPELPWERRETRDPEGDPEHLLGLMPPDPRMPSDPRPILQHILDGGVLDEFKEEYAETIVCGYGHLFGIPVGVLANNGVLFSDSARKATHFIMLCTQQKIPLLFVQNITGFLVGREAEYGGIARDGAKMVAAVATAKVPKITLITGASYGAGNYAMSGRGYDPRFLFTWPTSRTAVMGGEQAAGVLTTIRSRGQELSAEEEAEMKQEILSRYERETEPYFSTARLWDDGVIDPRDTRTVLGLALETCLNAQIEETKLGVLRV